MAQHISTAAWTALLATASIGAGCSTPAEGAGGAGTGGATVVSTSASPGPSSTHTAASTSVTSGTGVPFNCDPAADPGSLYEASAVTYGLDTISMCQYRGDVLLIIDTAAA